MEKSSFHKLLGEMVQLPCKIILKVLIRLNVELLYNPAILSCVYTQENENTYPHKNLDRNVLSTNIENSKKKKKKKKRTRKLSVLQLMSGYIQPVIDTQWNIIWQWKGTGYWCMLQHELILKTLCFLKEKTSQETTCYMVPFIRNVQ